MGWHLTGGADDLIIEFVVLPDGGCGGRYSVPDDPRPEQMSAAVTALRRLADDIESGAAFADDGAT